MTVSLRKVRASLGLPTSAPAYVIGAYHIVQKMDGNSWFPSPVPPLAKVKAAIDALGDAETKAMYAGGNSKSDRDLQWRRVKLLMDGLKTYVEGVANEDLEHAETIITSAGMHVVVTHRPSKSVLAVFQGRVSGTVRLVAKMIAKECTYYWQMSADGGKTWINLTPTVQTETMVEDLEPGKTYQFRLRGLTNKLSTVWCDPVPFLVK